MTTKSKTNHELMLEFIDAVYANQNAEKNASGNRQANRAAQKMRKIYHELAQRSDGNEVMLELLVHESPFVRIWAGPFGLTHFPDKFEPMLEELANGPPGPVSLRAGNLLEAWRDGCPLV